MKTKSAKEKVTYSSLFFHPGMGISTQEVLRPPCYQEIMAKGDSLRRYPPLMQWVLVPHFLLLTTNKCPTWLAHSSRTRLCLSASCNPSAEFGGLGSACWIWTQRVVETVPGARGPFFPRKDNGSPWLRLAALLVTSVSWHFPQRTGALDMFSFLRDSARFQSFSLSEKKNPMEKKTRDFKWCPHNKALQGLAE